MISDLTNTVVLDLETYPNYILFAFKETNSKRVRTFEMVGEETFLSVADRESIKRLMGRVTYGFNSLNFDLPIILRALKGATARQCSETATYIIEERSPNWRTLKHFGLTSPNWEHFDLFEPSPGSMTSLKLYGARLHAPRLQDLPIAPGTMLKSEQMRDIKEYCINDLDTTISLFNTIRPEMELRVQMSAQYGIDLMSKSDAQIAEAVIVSELVRDKPKPPTYSKDNTFRFDVPPYIRFKSSQLVNVLEFIENHKFKIDGRGSIALPKELSKPIAIGNASYKIGVGGLHSQESGQFVEPDSDQLLIDQDVTSYYPTIILNQGLFPDQLGKQFLDVYGSIVERRITAKRRMQEIDDEIAKLELELSTITENTCQTHA